MNKGKGGETIGRGKEGEGYRKVGGERNRGGKEGKDK